MQILMGRERYRDVVNTCGRAPKQSDWVRIAVAYGKLGEMERAQEFAEKAVEARLPYAQVARARVLEAQGDLTGALDQAEACSLPDPGGRFAYAIARLLGGLGEHGEAKAVWRRALRHRPFLDAEYLERFADCCQRTGDTASAERARRLAARARET